MKKLIIFKRERNVCDATRLGFQNLFLLSSEIQMIRLYGSQRPSRSCYTDGMEK